jgi:hypothetical protein
MFYYWCILWVSPPKSSPPSLDSIKFGHHVMHVKCIHELCSLLDNIHWYSYVIWCCQHVLHWFWAFSTKSPFIYLVFNFRWHKNLLLVFWTLHELRGSKKGKEGRTVHKFWYAWMWARRWIDGENGGPPCILIGWPCGRGSFLPPTSVCFNFCAMTYGLT